jgi:hypothetical protein
MAFLRHIGKHGDRKIALVFREVPGEDHMCLVVYTELLNRHIHDPLMQCIESDIGQKSNDLADALNRTYTQDGRPILATLHKEGFLKKIQTEQVVMTPAPNQQIRLNELNKLLDEMQKGEEAVRRLSEIDQSRGLQDPAEVARRMRNNQAPQKAIPPSNGALGDQDIATNLRQQAERMAAEARGLLAESERLLSEAKMLDPTQSISQTKTRGRAKKESKADTEASTMAEVLASVAPVVKTRKPRTAKAEKV